MPRLRPERDNDARDPPETRWSLRARLLFIFGASLTLWALIAVIVYEYTR